MRGGLILLLLSSLTLVGCEKITGIFTGSAAQKALDAKTEDGESIGYACRISKKSPEDCMKENENYTPTSILTGWKDSDQDIHDGLIDPLMKMTAAPIAASAVPAASSAPQATPVPTPGPATAAKADTRKPDTQKKTK